MRISDRHKQQGWAMLPAGLHQACELYQSNHTKTTWQDLLRLTKGLWQNSSQDSARKPKLRYDKKQNTCSKLQTVQRIEIKEGIIGLLSVWLKSNSNTSRCCTELFSAIWQKTWEFSICPAWSTKPTETKPNGWSAIEMVSNIQRHRSVVLLGRLCPAHQITAENCCVFLPRPWSWATAAQSLCQAPSMAGAALPWAALCQSYHSCTPSPEQRNCSWKCC